MEQTTSTEFKSELLTEARVSLRLALPLAVAQLAQSVIFVVNSVMMGLLGTQNLAAGALGIIIYLSFLVVCVGILTAGGALAAEAFGAKNIDQVSQITAQGLWLAAAISLPAMLLLWNCDSILLFLGQEESTVVLTKSYLHAFAGALPAEVGFFYLKQIATAINFSQFATVIMVVSLLLNVPANYVLMFGYLGFPALGLAGIGWATNLILWMSFLASFIMIYFHPKTRPYKLFSYLDQFDKEIFFKIFQTGVPTGIQMITELGVFTVTAMLMGKLETSSLAGHEIAIQTSEFFLAIPLAFSYSATARIGQMMGEKNTVGLLRAAFVNLAFSVLFSFIVAIGFELFTSPIVSLYLDMNNPDNALAISRGINFLKLAGVYQIFRSIQFIAVGALLGLQDTLVPMLINTLSLWGIGLGGGYIMAITLGWEGIGFWYGLTLGMAISGLILIMRFNLINFTKIAEHESGKLEVELDEKSLSK